MYRGKCCNCGHMVELHEMKFGPSPGVNDGGLGVKLPITLWQNLRWQWMDKRKSGYDKTWQTFLLDALRHPEGTVKPCPCPA